MQLFGYNAFVDADTTNTAVKSSDVKRASSAAATDAVFAVRARRQVGDAAGDKRRRDVVVQIRRVDELDCYLTASRRGVISTWSNKVIVIIIIIIII